MNIPRRHHILCIEDHPDTCDLLGFYLGNEGYQITISTSYQDALPLTQKNTYDLIIVDRMLPDGDGIGLCRQIRNRHHSVPIIVHSADSRAAMQQEALKAGANIFIGKPAELEYLGETIKRLINGKAAGSSPDSSSSSEMNI